MNCSLSVYLDAIRFLAALGVLLYHAHGWFLSAIPYALGNAGGECVAVFFVLSGFVIRFVSVEKNENEWRKYAAARMARIVPVVLVSFFVSFIFGWISVNAGHPFYREFGPFTLASEAKDLVVSVLFLNEIWYQHVVFGINEPYWSLGFEVPFYILFGIFLFSRNKMRIFLMFGWLILYGPKIALLLPTWLLGAATYEYVKFHHNDRPRRALGVAIGIGSLILYWALKKKLIYDSSGTHGTVKFVDYHNLLVGAGYFFLVGLALALSVVAVSMFKPDSRGLIDRMAGPVQWLAGGSFSLYLLHLPLMMAILAIVPTLPYRPRLSMAVLLGLIGCCYLLAELAERRKLAARRLFNRLFDIRTLSPDRLL